MKKVKNFTTQSWLGVILTVYLAGLINTMIAQTAIPPTGQGTISDPYQINSLANLQWIADQVNSTTSPNTFSGVYFSQTADIDASDTKPGGSYGAEG